MREKKLFRDRAYKENKEEREVWRYATRRYTRSIEACA